MVALKKCDFGILLNIFIIELFFLFLPADIVAQINPPVGIISSHEHGQRHPEDVKFQKKLNDFCFRDSPIAGKVPYQSWPTKYVLSIPGGRCWNSEGWSPAVITQDNLLLKDTSYEYGPQAVDHSVFSQSSLPSPMFIDATVAVIGTHGSWNYYHWMIDVLPKLGLLEEAEIKADFYYILCSGASFEKETLSLLGIEEKVFCAKNALHIQAQTLLAPTMLSMPETPLFINLCPPLWSLEFLRKKFLKEEVFPSKRIYISRERAPYWRKVVNEDEVYNFLLAYSFSLIHLEDLSVWCRFD